MAGRCALHPLATYDVSDLTKSAEPGGAASSVSDDSKMLDCSEIHSLGMGCFWRCRDGHGHGDKNLSTFRLATPMIS
jgi:hypothetical protein